MTKKPFLLLPFLTLACSSCSFNPLGNLLGVSTYDTPEAYFLANGYTKFTKMEGLNKDISRQLSSFWQYRHYSSFDYILTPHGGRVVEYEESVRFKSPWGESIYLMKQGDINHYRSVSEAAYYQLPDGHLYITPHNWMVYVDDDDRSDWYILEEGDEWSRVNKEGLLTFNLEETPEIATAKAARGYAAFPKVVVPNNALSEYGAFGKIFESSDGTKQGYELMVPGYKVTEMAQAFSASDDYYVFKSQDDGVFGLEEVGQNAYYEIYDEASEYVIEIQYSNVMALYNVGNLSHPANAGTIVRIVHGLKADGGTAYNPNLDWTEEEKAFMEKHYGSVIPFIGLGKNYHIKQEQERSSDYENWMTVHLGGPCYVIYDNFYRSVIPEYGEILEKNGFVYHDFDPEIRNDKSAYSSWRNGPESYLYQCYVKQEENLAIKLVYSRIYGNLIRVYHLDQMRPFDPELDVDD